MPLANPEADNTPLVRWDASPGAAFYEVRIATDPLLANVVESGATTGVAYAIETILSNGDYYVGVTARSAGGVAGFSTPRGSSLLTNTSAYVGARQFQAAVTDASALCSVGWRTASGPRWPNRQ